MDLLELDSNKYRTILNLKRRIAEHSDLCSEKNIASEDDLCNRAIDEFGELAVKRLTQPSHIEFSSDDIVAITLSYQSGQSTYKIGKQFGCSKTTISTLLKRNGITVTNRKAQGKIDAKKVISMYERMCTTEEIAKHFEVSPYTINRCLRKNGVKIRGRWDYVSK